MLTEKDLYTEDELAAERKREHDRVRDRLSRAKRLAEMQANPLDGRHGTYTGYNYGCRCPYCVQAHSEYKAAYYKRTKAQRRAYQRKYYREHKDECNERSQNYYRALKAAALKGGLA